MRISIPLALCAIAAIAGCSSSGSGSSSAASSGGGDIVVGVVTTETGPNAVLGSDTLAVIKAKIDSINAQGGILGRHVTYKVVDSASSPDQGLLGAKSLIGSGVNVLIPDNLSIVASAIFPTSTENKVLTLGPCSATACGDGQTNPYQFSIAPTVANQAKAVVVGLNQVMPSQPVKIGQLATNDTTGSAFAKSIGQDAASYSSMSVVASQTFTAGAADLSVQLSKLKAAGANVVVVSGNIGQQDVQTIINDMSGLNYTATVAGAVSMLNTPFDSLKGSPQQLSKVYGLSLAAGVRTGDSAPDNSAVQEISKVVPKPVSGWSVVVANTDVLTWYQWAADKIHSTDPSKIAALLDTVGSLPASELPKGLLGYEDPGWTKTNHSTSDANQSNYWGFASPSQVIDGTYKGIVLSMPS